MSEHYVSRAGLKLAGAVEKFGLDFRGKVILDVGSSTGGFTDYALQNGAARVIAVDIGTNQLHPSLREDNRIELHEKADIRTFQPTVKPDIVLIDVSFVSLREILPAVAKICGPETPIIALLKPQFEAKESELNKGIVKNDTVRRRIMADFEKWAKKGFLINGKSDSRLPGSHGNKERLYLLKSL